MWTATSRCCHCDFPTVTVVPSDCKPKELLASLGYFWQCFVTRTKQITECKGTSSVGEIINYSQNSLCRCDGVSLQFQRSGIQTTEKTSRDLISKQQKQNKYFMLKLLAQGIIEPKANVQLQFFCRLG